MYLKDQYESQNKGLPMKFSLNEDGSFKLVGGKDKVDDNVGMLLAFVGWFRIYTQDYVLNAYRFFQNTTSYLYQFKNILRLQVMDIGRRYVPFANFKAVDIPLSYKNRKETTIYIQFGYKLRNTEEFQTIKRVIL